MNKFKSYFFDTPSPGDACLTEESKAEKPAETQAIVSEMISEYKDIVSGLMLEIKEAIDHHKEYVKRS